MRFRHLIALAFVCLGIQANALPSNLEAQTLFEADFNQYTAAALYTEANLDSDFNEPPWEDGVREERVSIVTGPDAWGGSGASLAVLFPADEHGTKQTGGQWKCFFDAPVEEAYLSYRVKFGAGFDFVRGGKLPGLAGGSAPTGSTAADGINGWTARLMWRTEFEGTSGAPEQLTSNAISYAKYVGSGPNGDSQEDKIYWLDADGNQTTFQSGIWYHVLQRVKMNTPNENDGVLEIWLDGQLVHQQLDVRFRNTADLAIDQFYFSTFFGGNSDWKTSKAETIYFDDFAVSTPQSDYLRVPNQFPSPQAAVDAANPGDTVLIRAGNWPGNLIIDKPITVFGVRDSVLVAGDSSQPCVRITSANASLKRMELIGGSAGVHVDASRQQIQLNFLDIHGTDDGVILDPNCHQSTVRDSDIFDNLGDGLRLHQSNELFCFNCNVFDNSGNGIVLDQCDTSDVLRNDCLENGLAGILVEGDAVHVRNNNSKFNQGRGFDLAGNEFVLINNDARFNDDSGFRIANADALLASLNYSRYNGGSGFEINQVTNSDLIQLVGRRNAFAGMDVSDSSASRIRQGTYDANDTIGIYLGSATSDLEVSDNLVKFNRSGLAIVNDGTNNTLSGNQTD